MLTKIFSNQIYLGEYGWHTGRFHFSFGDYQDPGNSHYGDLIAFNEFVVKAGFGFETHPHHEIEIISYCVEGNLMNADSMGNTNTIKRGDMQYTCAGSGITHSEMNNSTANPLRFVQIWIQPNSERLPPFYVSKSFAREERLNKILQISSGKKLENGIQVNQDMDIYVSEIDVGRQVQAGKISTHLLYLVCLEGSLNVNDLYLHGGDAAKVQDETALNLTAIENCHLILSSQ